MFRIYFTIMLLVMVGGITCAVLASNTLTLSLGLLLITVGGGGLSAGAVTYDSAHE